MNGLHDMGGMHGYGPVRPEPNEPAFHAEWEKRALALTLAMGATGEWNIDMSRATRESLPPLQYLSSSYYEIWLAALERLLRQRGLAFTDEIAAGHALHAAKPVARRLTAQDVPAALARGTPAGREVATPARFAVGQRVRMRNLHPGGHTRLPRYVRGRIGEIEAARGAFVFPDVHAHPSAPDRFDEAPQWLYTVRFEGTELWGEGSDPQLAVSVDAWESYMEAIDGAGSTHAH